MASYYPPSYYFNGINFNDDFYEIPNTTTSSGVSKSYVDNNFLNLTGGTLSGTLNGTTINATTNLQENGTNLSSKYLTLTGGTLTNTLTGTTINATTNLQENGTNLSSKYLQLTGGSISGYLDVNRGSESVPVSGQFGYTGDRLILKQGSSGVYPYSLGIHTNNLWYSVPSGAEHSFYIGGIEYLSLTSTSLTGTTINATTNLQENGTNLSSKYLTLTGGTLTNTLTGTTINATTNLQENGTSLSSKYLNLAGGTLTGALSGTSITTSGNITSSGIIQVYSTTVGYCVLNKGGAANTPGYLTFHKSNAIRIGYIGHSTTANYIDLETENGYLGYRVLGALSIDNALTCSGATTVNNTLNCGYFTATAVNGSTGYLGYTGRALSDAYYGGQSGTFTDLSGQFNGSLWVKSQVVISSDERIKKDIQDVNDDSALQKILLLKPKTYKYKDYIYKGTSNVYGFIAQEVREVIPEATKINKEIIPDIYDFGTYSSNIITTSNIDISNLLNTSNVVKILDNDLKEYICNVKNILSSNSFEIDIDIPSSNVLVYGKEVNDFTTMDKSYLYTLNISATQQLYALILELQNKITLLENRISILEGN